MALTVDTVRPLEASEDAVVPGDEELLEDVGVGLLDLVEQHDRFRVVAQAACESASAVGADIAGRDAEQAGGGDRLAVMRHVEMDERAIGGLGKALAEMGLA